MRGFRKLLTLVFAGTGAVLISTQLLAATATTQTTETVVLKESKILGGLDIRPSYEPSSDKFYSENSLEAGYQFNPNLKVSYYQGFNTNLFDPTGKTQGLDFAIQDAFVRARVNNVWKSSDSTTAFHYQPRVYLPTKASDRDAGLITRIRNYFVLTNKLNDKVSVSGYLIPIVHVYNQAGAVSAAGGSANPVFENRLYFITDVQIMKDLSLSLPVMFHQTRFSNFQVGAANNNSWGFTLWIWPELTYSLDDHYAVALSYYSGNLVESKLKDITIGDGLSNGIVQVSFQASL